MSGRTSSFWSFRAVRTLSHVDGAAVLVIRWPAQADPRYTLPSEQGANCLYSSVLELLIFSIPSVVYVRRLQNRGKSRREAWAAVGWQPGPLTGYWIAIGVLIALTPIIYLATRSIPVAILYSPHVVISESATGSGIVASSLLALAEEVLFRGLIAGRLLDRYGFMVGNGLQALIFLAPHLLLLLVSITFWPLALVQFIAGWLLGAVRYKSGSILPGWLAHAGANVLAPLLFALLVK